jgi:predicted Holliday junction resolvase-like endonuclease
MTTLEQAVDSLAETVGQASEIIKSLREENRKQKEALDYVKMWLNENIDEGSKDSIEQDSANLLQHVKEHLGE